MGGWGVLGTAVLKNSQKSLLTSFSFLGELTL